MRRSTARSCLPASGGRSPNAATSRHHLTCSASGRHLRPPERPVSPLPCSSPTALTRGDAHGGVPLPLSFVLSSAVTVRHVPCCPMRLHNSFAPATDYLGDIICLKKRVPPDPVQVFPRNISRGVGRVFPYDVVLQTFHG